MTEKNGLFPDFVPDQNIDLKPRICEHSYIVSVWKKDSNTYEAVTMVCQKCLKELDYQWYKESEIEDKEEYEALGLNINLDHPDA